MKLCQTALSLSIIFMLASGAAIADTDSAAVMIAKGDDLLQDDKLSDSIESYKAAIKANPQIASAHQKLGHVLSLSGDLQASLDEERKALELDQHNGEAHCNLGYVFGLQQKYRAAVEEEKLAIAIDPNNSSAYSILGLSLASLGDYDLAISAFNQAIALDPSDLNSCMNLAAALGRKKDYAGAVSMYKRAIDLNQSNPNTYLGLGAALGKTGDLQGQVKAYEQAVALAPTNPANHGRLGFALSQVGNWRDALREGSVANGLRIRRSSTDFLKMFLTTWAAIFVAFGLLFTVIFSGSRFKAQPGESLIKSFFLTFYKDKPGRFVLTNRRIVFVPEAFSTWFGSTRVSMELDQITEVEAHSTISGGRLSILSSNGSVHQFSMPNLVLEPLTKQLKALAVAHSPIESDATSTTASSTIGSSMDANATEPVLDSSISLSPFADEVDDKDAVIITIVAHDPDLLEQTTDESKDDSSAPAVDV
jgi:tetratricopeptide (TPR) repeat protein